MSVTLFATGITITDEMATRLSAFSDAHFVRMWQNRHDGDDPPGWPDPSPAEQRALIEWGIKQLIRRRIENWELALGRDAVTVDPWSGGDVESAGA